MKVQITLKSGVTVEAGVSKWTTIRDLRSGDITGLKWADQDGEPAELAYVRMEDVSAVIVVRQSSDKETSDDDH